MADLSIDDLRRLARNFLVGRGGEAELEDTKRAMDQDPQLAMEFLQQMQTALDDVAPAGFSPVQWSEIDARVHTLIAPLAKSGLGLGFLGKLFAKLFKKKSAPAAPARIKRKGASPEPTRSAGASGESPTSLLSSEAVVAPSGALPAEGMEEMAPIMSGAAAPPAPIPVAAPAAAMTAADAPLVGAALARPSSARKNWATLLIAILAMALLWGAWTGLRVWKIRRSAPAPLIATAPAPQPTPKPSPTPKGPPRRLLPPSPDGEPLPSELPPMTPQPAGRVEAIPGLDTNDSEGRRALPLP